jgi:hypothetical protein
VDLYRLDILQAQKNIMVLTWTGGGNLGTARREIAGCGTQTAGLGFGGYNGSTVPGATEEYDGSTWTAGGGLGTPRQSLAGCGIQTSGLAFGGYAGVSEVSTLKNTTVLLGQLADLWEQQDIC